MGFRKKNTKPSPTYTPRTFKLDLGYGSDDEVIDLFSNTELSKRAESLYGKGSSRYNQAAHQWYQTEGKWKKENHFKPTSSDDYQYGGDALEALYKGAISIPVGLYSLFESGARAISGNMGDRTLASIYNDNLSVVTPDDLKLAEKYNAIDRLNLETQDPQYEDVDANTTTNPQFQAPPHYSTRSYGGVQAKAGSINADTGYHIEQRQIGTSTYREPIKHFDPFYRQRTVPNDTFIGKPSIGQQLYNKLVTAPIMKDVLIHNPAEVTPSYVRYPSLHLNEASPVSGGMFNRPYPTHSDILYTKGMPTSFGYNTQFGGTQHPAIVAGMLESTYNLGRYSTLEQDAKGKVESDPLGTGQFGKTFHQGSMHQLDTYNRSQDRFGNDKNFMRQNPNALAVTRYNSTNGMPQVSGINIDRVERIIKEKGGKVNGKPIFVTEEDPTAEHGVRAYMQVSDESKRYYGNAMGTAAAKNAPYAEIPQNMIPKIPYLNTPITITLPEIEVYPGMKGRYSPVVQSPITKDEGSRIETPNWYQKRGSRFIPEDRDEYKAVVLEDGTTHYVKIKSRSAKKYGAYPKNPSEWTDKNYRRLYEKYNRSPWHEYLRK